MLEIQKWLFHSATAELKNFAGDSSASSVLAALAVAGLFGFVHALMPGHGKVALVSYYLGHPTRFIAGVATKFHDKDTVRSPGNGGAAPWGAILAATTGRRPPDRWTTLACLPAA